MACIWRDVDSVLLQGNTVPGHAARALWNLTSKNTANQDAAREAGAVPLLVAMLSTAPKLVRLTSWPSKLCSILDRS